MLSALHTQKSLSVSEGEWPALDSGGLVQAGSGRWACPLAWGAQQAPLSLKPQCCHLLLNRLLGKEGKYNLPTPSLAKCHCLAQADLKTQNSDIFLSWKYDCLLLNFF